MGALSFCHTVLALKRIELFMQQRRLSTSGGALEYTHVPCLR